MSHVQTEHVPILLNAPCSNLCTDLGMADYRHYIVIATLAETNTTDAIRVDATDWGTRTLQPLVPQHTYAPKSTPHYPAHSQTVSHQLSLQSH